MALWAVAGPSGLIWALSAAGLVAVAAAMVFGQTSHPSRMSSSTARAGTAALGKLIYTTLLMGHHASAACWSTTPCRQDKDPNSAPRGEWGSTTSPGATRGAFVQGFATGRKPGSGGARETALVASLRLYPRGRGPDYGLAGLGRVGRPWRAARHGGYAQVQILMADYVQHYGLRPAPGPTAGPSLVGPQHSWNAPMSFPRR